MSVYERVGALGEWSIKLSPAAPKSLRDLFVPYSHVVVLPGRVYADRLSDAAILAGALYTGVVLETPGRGGDISGPGLAYWLGDSDNKGSIIETLISSTSRSLPTWVLALTPPALANGTITSTGAGGNAAGSFQWVTYRQALDEIMNAFGTEWRINPNFTLDAALPLYLYGTTPVAIALHAGGGSDDVYVGLDAHIVATANWSDYASKVWVSGPGGLASSGGASPYRDGDGNLTTRVRVVDSPSGAPGSESATAANLVNLWSSVTGQRDMQITVNRFALTRLVKAGQYIYVYDPEFGLQDDTNPVRHQGRVTFPLSVRVLGVRWPIAAPMSVLLRYYSGGSYLYADLSDYIEYESGVTTLEV